MVRITAQLIDTATDTHRWSATYDRPLTAENLFAIQGEIATEIVAAIGSTLRLQTPTRVRIDGGTAELDTYEAFLRASDLFRRRSYQNLPTAIAMFEEIVADDPGFARGWAGLAAAYRVAPGWGIEGDRDWNALAGRAADRATSLDDRLALPYTVRSGLARDAFRWDSALEQAAWGIERERGNAHTWYTRGATYLDMGYLGKAQRDFERTMVRGQSSYIGQFVLAYAARGQSAAALFLMASRFNYRGDDQPWRLEPDYRYLTDPEYSPRQYRADVESGYAATFGREAPPDLRDLARWPEPAERQGGGQFELFFLWNPFSPALRRPELREESRAVRDRWFRAAGLYDYWRAHEIPDRCRPVGRDAFACD